MFEILVIDDEVDRQSWFKQLAGVLGWSVAAARSSAEAYALLRERRFDIAFFDHDLGENDTGSTIATRVLMEPDTYHCPLAIWVHSANPVGAANIASKFRSARVPTIVSAFGMLCATPTETLQGVIHDLVHIRE